MGTAAFALSAFLAGWFLSPLLTTYTSAGSLDDITTWALKGPGKDIPTPLMGVYLFKGLNPSFLADLSYAHSWDPTARSFIFDMAGPGLHGKRTDHNYHVKPCQALSYPCE
jgi:hypothetical protein